MTDFNPLAGALLGSAQVQQQSDVQKQRQVRRAQAVRKNVATEGDQFEHQVESAEEPPPNGDEPGGRHPPQDEHRDRRKDAPEGDDRPHIDVTA